MKELIRRVLREHTREMGEGREPDLSDEEVRQEAKKYDYVRDFREKSPKHYNRAKKIKIIKDITKDMMRNIKSWKGVSPEEAEQGKIESRKETTKKYRENKKLEREKEKLENGESDKESRSIKYEKEFVGKHFKILHKNCSVDVKLKIDLQNVNRVMFNSLSNENKLETILDFVLNNSDRSIDDNLSIITDNMLLTFIDNMVKSDLECIFPVLEKGTNNIIIDKGSLIEVKNKEWGKSDFLCEVFKPDSQSKFLKRLKEKYGYYNITNYISMLNTLIVNKLLKDVKNKVIGDIRKNTFGVFFGNYVFVKMENITLEWKPIGYAGKTRIAINYMVDSDAKKYKLNLTKTDINDIDAVSH